MGKLQIRIKPIVGFSSETFKAKNRINRMWNNYKRVCGAKSNI